MLPGVVQETYGAALDGRRGYRIQSVAQEKTKRPKHVLAYQ